MADPTLNINVRANTADAQRSLSGFKTTFTELSSAVNLAMLGFNALKDAAVALFKTGFEGAELERTRGQLENLAASIGTTADALVLRMGDASGGLMSNAEMIRAATDIISLGLADNETDVVRLATVVSELGWDMQQVILTFANDSTMRLDALGLSVEDVTARAKEFEEAGMSATKAFDQAVLAAAEDKIKLVGSAAETAAGQYKMLENNVANAKDEWNEFINRTILPGVKAINDAAREEELLTEALEKGIITMEDYRGEVDGGIFQTINNTAVVEKARLGLEEYHRQFEEGIETSKSHDQAMLVSAGIITDLGTAAEESAALVDILSGALSGLGLSATEAAQAEIMLKLATGELTEAQADQLTAAAALKTIFQAGDGLNFTLMDYVAIVQDGVVTTEELARAIGLIEGDHEVNIDINVTGDIIPDLGGFIGGGKGTGRGGTGGREFHHGADFVVPPGHPNDSFPIFVESGERVQVTPASEMARGGGSSPAPIVYVLLDGKQIAAEIQHQGGRSYRQARSSGAALTGR